METYSFEAYEVLSEHTHEYASTHVSGGGSNSDGSINAVSSHTTHHSNQALWLRNIKTGNERTLKLSGVARCDVRPGHTLLVAWDKKGSLVATQNANTSNSPGFGQTWFSPYTLEYAAKSKKSIIFYSLVAAVGLAMPVFGLFCAVIGGVTFLSKGRMDLVLTCMIAAIAQTALYFHFFVGQSYGRQYSDITVIITGAIIGFSAFYIMNREKLKWKTLIRDLIHQFDDESQRVKGNIERKNESPAGA